MNKIIEFFKGIFFIFLYFILTLIVFYTFKSHMNHETNLILANTSSIFAYLLILFVFIIIFRKVLIPDFYDFKKNYKKYIFENFKYWIIGLIVMWISNAIIGTIVGSMPTTEELNQNALLNLPYASFVSMVIVAPIIEELITRQTFKNVFNNMYFYVIISGLIFGSLHLLNITTPIEILYVIPYSALGCVFAVMYYKTNNIWTNIFFHSLHNLMCILIIFAGV